jgi:hypothetical protein
MGRDYDEATLRGLNAKYSAWTAVRCAQSRRSRLAHAQYLLLQPLLASPRARSQGFLAGPYLDLPLTPFRAAKVAREELMAFFKERAPAVLAGVGGQQRAVASRARTCPAEWGLAWEGHAVSLHQPCHACWPLHVLPIKASPPA